MEGPEMLPPAPTTCIPARETPLDKTFDFRSVFLPGNLGDGLPTLRKETPRLGGDSLCLRRPLEPAVMQELSAAWGSVPFFGLWGALEHSEQREVLKCGRL